MKRIKDHLIHFLVVRRRQRHLVMKQAMLTVIKDMITLELQSIMMVNMALVMMKTLASMIPNQRIQSFTRKLRMLMGICFCLWESQLSKILGKVLIIGSIEKQKSR